VKILRKENYKVMPWKNGGGTTTEIMIWPEGATVATGFDWRVSMADVASDGPFSSFPDHYRALLILNGNGLGLTIADDPEFILGPDDDTIVFEGATPISVRLVDGPVRDFNVMYRVGNGRYFWAWLRADTLTQQSGHQLSADFQLFYAFKGTFVANDQLVREGDTLVVTCGEMPELLATPEAEVILVTIWDDASD
jgi:uncharacterized protein